MLHVERRARDGAKASDTVTLFYEERKRDSVRARSESGVELTIELPHDGHALRDGDLLEAATGEVLAVRAARELVSEATTGDPLLFARAVYLLGFRQIPLQIAVGVVRYRHDPAIDRQLSALGLDLASREAPFEPDL